MALDTRESKQWDINPLESFISCPAHGAACLQFGRKWSETETSQEKKKKKKALMQGL